MAARNNTPEVLRRHLDSLFTAPENLPGAGISRLRDIGVSAVRWARGDDQWVILSQPDKSTRLLQAIKDDGTVVSTKDFAFNDSRLLFVAEQFQDSREAHNGTEEDLTRVGESFDLQQALGMTKPTLRDEREFWGHLASGLERIGVSFVFIDEM